MQLVCLSIPVVPLSFAMMCRIATSLEEASRRSSGVAWIMADEYSSIYGGACQLPQRASKADVEDSVLLTRLEHQSGNRRHRNYLVYMWTLLDVCGHTQTPPVVRRALLCMEIT